MVSKWDSFHGESCNRIMMDIEKEILNVSSRREIAGVGVRVGFKKFLLSIYMNFQSGEGSAETRKMR